MEIIRLIRVKRLLLLLALSIIVLVVACNKKNTEEVENKVIFDNDGVYINEDLYIDGNDYEDNINIHYIFTKPIDDILVEEIDYESDVDASVRVVDCETVVEDFAEKYDYKGYSVGDCIIKCCIEDIASPGYIKINKIKLAIDGDTYELSFKNIMYSFLDYRLESEDDITFNVAPSYAMNYSSGWEINLSVESDDITIDELYIDDCVSISDLQISKNEEMVSDTSFSCDKGDVINYELEFDITDKLKIWSNANFTYKIFYYRKNDDTRYCVSRNVLYVTMADSTEYKEFIDSMLKK